jgi:ParB family transcriptional regulator, chromosome partitioning protein
MANSVKDDQMRPRLGRGLAALLGEATSEAAAVQQTRSQRRIPLEFLRPNPFNPRQSFSEAELENLADSIRKRGVLQPILVRAVQGAADSFEIIAGERRWRAAQKAGIFDVPANVIEATDRQALEIAIVENVQRSDLNAIEEAQGYQKLCVDFGYSHADLAQEIGKSRSHVANTLRLLNLPAEARQLLMDGTITAGHARALLSVEDPGFVAQKIAEQHLTVRDIERLGRDHANERGGKRLEKTGESSNPEYNSVQVDYLAKEMSDVLGLNVIIKSHGTKGTILIQYESFDQLEGIRSVILNR